MRSNQLLEVHRRVSQRRDHAPRGRQERLLVVLIAVPFALLGAALLLVPGFVVVRVVHQHQALNGNQHLQHVTPLRVPHLGALPGPRREKRQTHLAVLVQVRVHAFAARVVRRRRRLIRVPRAERKVKHEDVVVVGRALRPEHRRAQQIGARFEHAHPDVRGQRRRERAPLATHGFGPSDEVRGRRSRSLEPVVGEKELVDARGIPFGGARTGSRRGVHMSDVSALHGRERGERVFLFGVVVRGVLFFRSVALFRRVTLVFFRNSNADRSSARRVERCRLSTRRRRLRSLRRGNAAQTGKRRRQRRRRARRLFGGQRGGASLRSLRRRRRSGGRVRDVPLDV